MIFGKLKNIDRYYGISPYIKRAVEFVKGKNWDEVKFGESFKIDGERLFVNTAVNELVDKDRQVLEFHRKYFDIHIILEGEEVFGWKDVADCVDLKSEYNEEKDYGLYNDKGESYIKIGVGEFAIVFPEDAHAPIIGEGKVKKLVVKAIVED